MTGYPGCVATRNELLEQSLHLRQLSYLLSYGQNSLSGAGLDFGTSMPIVPMQFEHLSDVTERKPDSLRALDEAQAIYGVVFVSPVTVWGPWRFSDQAALLVVTNGCGRYSSAGSYLTNVHRNLPRRET